MKSEIMDYWKDWKAGTLKPNKRQLAILEVWSAFLDEHPANFEDIVNIVPDTLTELWEIGSKPSRPTPNPES